MIDWVLSTTGSCHSLELSETEAGWRSQFVGDCYWQALAGFGLQKPCTDFCLCFHTISMCVCLQTSPFYKDTTCIRLGPDFLNMAHLC